MLAKIPGHSIDVIAKTPRRTAVDSPFDYGSDYQIRLMHREASYCIRSRGELFRRLCQVISLEFFLVGLVLPMFEMSVAFPFGSVMRTPWLIRSLSDVWQEGHAAYALLLVVVLLIIPLVRRLDGLLRRSSHNRRFEIAMQFDLTALLVLALAITSASSEQVRLASGAYCLLVSSIAQTVADLKSSAAAQRQGLVRPSLSPYATPLLVSASLLFVASLRTPFLHFRVFGFFSGVKTLLGGVALLWTNSNYLASIALGASSVGLPVLKLGVLAYFLSTGDVSRWLFRFVHRASPWSMLEIAAVFILLIHAILEPGVDSAPGPGMWLFALSVLTTTAIFWGENSIMTAPAEPDSVNSHDAATSAIKAVEARTSAEPPGDGEPALGTKAGTGGEPRAVPDNKAAGDATSVAFAPRRSLLGRSAAWAGVVLLGGVLCWIVAAYSPLRGDPFQRLSTDNLLALLANPVPSMAGNGDVAVYRIIKELKQRALAPAATHLDRQRIEHAFLAALESGPRHSEYTKDLCILVLADSFSVRSAKFAEVVHARIDRLRRECKRGEEATVDYHVGTSQAALAHMKAVAE